MRNNMTITTIETTDGVAKIDSQLFAGYNSEAQEVLRKIANLTDDYKLIVETVAETTGLKKPKVSKFFKARYAESTELPAQEGELFLALNDVLDN